MCDTFTESSRDRFDYESELDQLLEAQDLLTARIEEFAHTSSEVNLQALKEAKNNFWSLKAAFLNNWQIQKKGR